MSSALSIQRAQPGAALAGGNRAIAAVVLALFVVAAVLAAGRKDVTRGFDELAHASYVAHVQSHGDAWPRLETMRLMDPTTFRFTEAPNYLNHPPLFYALLAALGPKLEGRPQNLLVHRLIDVAIVTAGLGVLLWLGIAVGFSREEYYAYAVPLACIPVLAPLAGAINNDDLAFLGGALAVAGTWQLAAAPRASWLTLALAGVMVASSAKLTGLLLAGGAVGAVMLYLLWRGRIGWRYAAAAAVAVALAAAPYLIFTVQYGSPTPETPAQLALLADGAHTAGWADQPRLSFPAYTLYFLVGFLADWMPALTPRNALNAVMLIVPLAAIGCALAGAALSLRRLFRGGETGLDVVVAGGMLAIAVTLAAHLAYSYQRHLASGWMMDAYPRYYLPLAVVVPLAAISLLRAVEAPRRRAALLTFLITGPILFRLFGAPLG